MFLNNEPPGMALSAFGSSEPAGSACGQGRAWPRIHGCSCLRFFLAFAARTTTAASGSCDCLSKCFRDFLLEAQDRLEEIAQALDPLDRSCRRKEEVLVTSLFTALDNSSQVTGIEIKGPPCFARIA